LPDVGNMPPPPPGGRSSRLWCWVRRYLPAELAGTTAAVVAAVVTAGAGDGPVAVAASWAESIAFYTVMTARELRRVDLVRQPKLRRAFSAVRDTTTEFGVAEVVDTLALRPLLMYAFIAPLGTVAGVIAGKIATDVVFYTLAIAAYELRERGRARASGDRQPTLPPGRLDVARPMGAELERCVFAGPTTPHQPPVDLTPQGTAPGRTRAT
jgi:hypothetical protein